MRTATLACWTALSSFCSADSNASQPLTSKQILSTSFQPPPVFKNVNLVRNIDLTKGYPRETINVVVENVDQAPQHEYYLPFEADVMARVGGLEARYKNEPEKGTFAVDAVEYDTRSPTEFYRIRLPTPLQPSAKQTLSITYSLLSALHPLPAHIDQAAPQFLQYALSALAPSAYPTANQKTKLKFPSASIPDYTLLPAAAGAASDPQKAGASLTYGPYADVPAGAVEPITVRYDFTRPLLHATLLERDVEVSHWGGNLAAEERYWLVNRAAKLANHFSRVKWQMSQYASPATTALRELRVPLQPGSLNPYFTDDIGNVSTSRFRPGAAGKEALLELKPRYPLFGDWKYSFKIGWDAELATYLRKLAKGEGYVLKIPFLEGPRMVEGIEYERVQVRVILPEGAKNINFATSVPLVSSGVTTHRTFMDTRGRPTLALTALNVVDDWRGRELVVTYDYPWTAGYRKPLTITVAALSLFVAVWAVGNLDVSIKATGRGA